MKKPPTEAELTKQVREWNETVPPGSLVKYFAVIGERWHYEIFRTSGQAYILSGHTAVVHLDKKSGCVSLDACELYERAVPKDGAGGSPAASPEAKEK